MLQANIVDVNIDVANTEILAALQTTQGQILTTHQALKTGSKGSGRERKQAAKAVEEKFS